jgi:hypothetical protein
MDNLDHSEARDENSTREFARKIVDRMEQDLVDGWKEIMRNVDRKDALRLEAERNELKEKVIDAQEALMRFEKEQLGLHNK